MTHPIKLILSVFMLSCFAGASAFGGICDFEDTGQVSLREVICKLQVLTGVRQDSPPESRGSVEGYIVATSEDAAGLSYASPGGIEVQGRFGDGQMMSTETDDTGFFRFSDAPPGPAVIQIMQDGAPSSFFRLEVDADKTVALHVNLDLAEVPLEGGVEGVVRAVDENGNHSPLPDALIRLTPAPADITVHENEDDSGYTPPLYKALTDAHGYYSINGVPAGHYILTASKPGFKKVLSAVRIIGARFSQRDFMLFPIYSEEFGVLFGSVAEKSVANTDSAARYIPVPSLEVRLTPVSESNTGLSFKAITNDKGRFMFHKAPAGEYRLIIDNPDFAFYERLVWIEADLPGVAPVISPPPDDPYADSADGGDSGKAALFGFMRAQIGFFCIGPHGGWHSGVNFSRVILKRNKVEEKAVLSGMVFFPENGQKTPVPNADVTLESVFPFPDLENVLADDGGMAADPVTVTTDPQGRYAFNDLYAGEYHLHAAPPDTDPGFNLFDDMIFLNPGDNHRDIALTKIIICDDTTPCPSDGYCARPSGQCEGQGECMKKPEVCPDIHAPVCGCDGVTYGNECEAAAAGIPVLYEGECLPEGETASLSGRITDGAVDCATGADCIAGVPDAFLELFQLSQVSPRPPFHTHTYTDEDGFYTIAGIPIEPDSSGTVSSAEFEIHVEAEQYMPHTETITLTPGENTWSAEIAPFTPCVEDHECGGSGDSFCARPFGECGGPGICKKRPEACYMMYDPVCGCDGNTYGNECEAFMFGVNVKYKGTCENSPR